MLDMVFPEIRREQAMYQLVLATKFPRKFEEMAPRY